ncbi:MAG: hypothetical protein CMD35_00520 [Flavobacteriales bacterium]|nr:hypothetical protein [Flavobacteriales bacterium]
MENHDFEAGNFEDIPVEFYCDSNKSSFKECTFCKKNLITSSETYLIEKSFKINPNNGKKNTVFEYAICMSCNIKKMNAMSEESISNIKSYMEDNFFDKELELNANSGINSFDKCAVTGKKVKDLLEYNIIGQFFSNKMISGYFPLLLSSEIGGEIQELLSQKTKDEFDDFMNTINDIPPELKELFKTKRPILV